jgi:hypothetical protein
MTILFVFLFFYERKCHTDGKPTIPCTFRKSLKLSGAAKKERSVGETVNLMSIDSQRIMDVIMSLNLLWSSPLTITLSIYSLWAYLGQ